MKSRLKAVIVLWLASLLPFSYPASATTAGDVVDRESLEAFVRAAEARLDRATTLLEFRDALEDFRNDEAWKKGSIYLFIFTTEGVFVFHGDDPSLEGENHIDLEDANGVKILQEGIAAAAEGGGFVEYLWPDPAVAGDEETGSPKVGYAIPYSALGRDFVLGSGFYPGSAGVEAPPGEQPETPRDSAITAAEVVDGETLEAFVEGAKARIEEIDEGNELLTPFISSLAVEGDWKHGNTYLILMSDEGIVLFHADDENAGDKNLHAIEDDRGNTVVQDLIAASSTGGQVEYYWDDPAQEGDEETAKIAYATQFSGQAYGNTVILIGGYYQDVSHVPPPVYDLSLIPRPEVTAADVTDLESLRAFVIGGMQAYVTAVREHGAERYRDILNVFRAEEGDWRHGSIYLFIFTTNGYVIFHGADRTLETRNVIDSEDINGFRMVEALIKAARAGGDFVQYYYNDPAVTGDEDTGSPKISYARSFVARSGREIVVGAGIYGLPTLDEAIRTEVDATVLGDSVEGLTVELSRAIAGRPRAYAWSAVTDTAGKASLTISGSRRSHVGGFYEARARTPDREIVGQWHSIPLNRGRRQVLELTLGGGMRVVAVERLDAAKQAAEPGQPLAGGLEPNAPNPFNSSTQISYRLGSPGLVRLVIYNTLGQQVRTLVDGFQAAGAYQVLWDARDRQGSAVAAGVYFARLHYPGGVQTRRMLYLR